MSEREISQPATTSQPCPKCGSRKVHFRPKLGEWLCLECDHEWREGHPAKATAAIRIFLSYGRDVNEPLVRRIRQDLERRGHTVWFDKSGVKEQGIVAGEDWRRSITEGILDSQHVLTFLSKHSTRDPGVCLDEIGIAIGVKGGSVKTILVENETDVRPPPSVSHIQWLDMHDWRQAHGTVTVDNSDVAHGDAGWEEWYRTQFQKIVRNIEIDEIHRFAGEIEELSRYLKPISSETRVAALLSKRFVGRRWLFEAVEKWRTAQNHPSRLLWITARPGFGKSAFAANFVHFGRDKVVAAHFVEWDKPSHRNPCRIVRSLAFQLATRWPDYRKLLLTLPEIGELESKTNPSELFDYLLTTPLSGMIDGGRQRHLIVVDGLDEASEAARNPLVEMLARDAARLPKWLGFVITGRPEFEIKHPLQDLNPLSIDAGSEENLQDVREYVQLNLASQLNGLPDAKSLIEEILKRSEGAFLYAEHFCKEVQCGNISIIRPDQFPAGLGAAYYQWFRRQYSTLSQFQKQVRPALCAILAARQPLPLEILKGIFNWRDEEVRDFTQKLGSLFTVKDERVPAAIQPFHKSIVDWLTDASRSGSYYVSMNEGHALLAKYGWKRYLEDVDKLDQYFIGNLLEHLFCASEYQKIVRCCEEGKLFLKKWHYPGTWIRFEDFSKVANTMIDRFPMADRERYAEILATAFANLALELRNKHLAYEQPWRLYAKHLRENDEDAFSDYRDSFFKFLYASATAAVIASQASRPDSTERTFGQRFQAQFREVYRWHAYLSSASAELGLSGMLEDTALELYQAWKGLVGVSSSSER